MIPSPSWLIFNLIVELLILILVILVPLGIISGIVFIFVRKAELDLKKKSIYKKVMIWSFVGPIGGLIFILIVWGFVYVLGQTLA